MTRFWTLSGAVASAASLAIVSLALRASARPASPVPTVAALSPAVVELAAEGKFSYAGAGSCAASACHGGTEPVKDEAISHALRNEHTTWVNNDAHAGAYEVLLGDRSKQIAKNLGKRTGKEIEAHRDSRCTACHETPRTLGGQPDGVSCESCHGPAGSWLTEHTVYGWKGAPKEAKEQLGFRDLNNNATRARTCAGCHVGSPAKDGIEARDVNHDLIAAGHPRLNWEFSAYSANYPKHWRISPPEAADLDARLWVIGQVATMAAALDLLNDRADRTELSGDKKAPWPEFAEYACYSCHFSLNEKLRAFNRDPAVPLGVPAWGSWNVPLLKLLGEIHPIAPPIDTDLTALRETMGNLRTKPKDVKAPAEALKTRLNSWLDGHAEIPLKPGEVTALFKALNAANLDSKSKIVTGWDSAAQLYLALSAVHASQKKIAPSPTDKKIDDELAAKLKELGFVSGYDSPHAEK